MTTAEEKLKRMLELAEKATPGPWFVAKYAHIHIFGISRVSSLDYEICRRPIATRSIHISKELAEFDQNAPFIAAANPTTTRAIIECLMDAMEALKTIADVPDKIGLAADEMVDAHGSWNCAHKSWLKINEKLGGLE